MRAVALCIPLNIAQRQQVGKVPLQRDILKQRVAARWLIPARLPQPADNLNRVSMPPLLP
jgi:hypothetical protein